ncbi:MAG: hypothetical protein AAB641_02095 [Patescibacteria group bacterium]
MSLTEEVAFDKEGHIESAGWRIPLFRKLFLALVIILLVALSFGLGRLSVSGVKESIRIEFDPSISKS